MENELEKEWLKQTINTIEFLLPTELKLIHSDIPENLKEYYNKLEIYNDGKMNKSIIVYDIELKNKNIDSLKSTMSTSGRMELILPNTKTTYTVDEFVNLHAEWFKDSTWTMKTKILNIEPRKYIGTATTEAIYREPNRNGKPYLNHMIVSYVLEKGSDNIWYVIKDHASSLKKSTN